jgi:hypothetical protein
MHERARRKETIGRGELFFLSHPVTGEVLSGYGLTMQPGAKKLLVGLLMVDRPHPADPEWLAEVEAQRGRGAGGRRGRGAGAQGCGGAGVRVSCLATETNIGVIHVCHAADSDIEGFANRPVSYQWQLIKMPTAPLIRLQLTVLDRPTNPYRFESFLNVAEEDQARVLAQLAGQDELYLAFYGDDLSHRFTKVINHDRQQWQYLDELVAEAPTLFLQSSPQDWKAEAARMGGLLVSPTALFASCRSRG